MHNAPRIVKNFECILFLNNSLREQDGPGRYCKVTECYKCGWNKTVAEKRKKYPLRKCKDKFWRTMP